MIITYVVKDGLYINLTNRCPCSCVFCLRQYGKSVGDADDLWLEREPTKEEVLADILARDLSKFKELVFCGFGEPLTRFEDVKWICEKLRQASGIKIRINTNGLADLMTGRSCAHELAGLVDVMSVSLNAPTPGKYDAVCRPVFGGRSLDAILAFTSACCEVIPEVYMTVVDRMSSKEIEACRKLCESTGATLRVREYIEG